jgi:probable rRNA maturation factor
LNKDAEINFFSEEIKFLLKDKIRLREWIYEVVKKEKKDIEFINYIFCSDAYLLKLNKTYLQHNYFTDVITFSYDEGEKQLKGDIYISIERVKENAKDYSRTFYNELHRVMIHGVLHLIGYEDNTDKERELIRKKEDKYLSMFHVEHV